MTADETGLFERAVALCEEGDFGAACELLRWLVEHEPDGVQGWNLLARAELEAQNYEAATAAAESALNLAPTVELHLIAAVSLIGQGSSEGAELHARRAISMDPFDWRAPVLLARSLVRDGASSEAREIAARAVMLAPSEPEVHLTAGRVAAASGERDEAKRSFRRVLELDPGSSAAQHELARLRLRHRVNDPAALADTAGGFMRALNVDPAAERSRRSLELVLRLFLSRTAYLLLLDAFIVGRLLGSSGSAAARFIPPLLLLVPAFYAWRFFSRATPAVRQHLRQILVAERSLLVAVGLEALAALSVIAAAVLPGSSRAGLAGVAGLAAIVGRLILHSQVEHASRAVHGSPPQPAVRTSLLWVVVFLLALMAFALGLATVRASAGPGALLLGVLIGAAAVSLGRVARRRRTDRV